MAVTQKQIDKVIGKLSEIRDEMEDMRNDKEEVLCNAQDAERPNEDRIEKLETQFNILEEVCYSLDECISQLEGYET